MSKMGAYLIDVMNAETEQRLQVASRRIMALEAALLAARGYTVNRTGFPRPITRRIDALLGLPADLDTKHKRRDAE